MSEIKTLDKSTAKIIDSTVLINSLFAVIKELVENAIDSNPTRIKIDLEDDLIRVTDNGKGMNKEDIIKSIEDYSTSKYISLEEIKHLGFRGKSLSFIFFLSKTTIISSVGEEGYKLNPNKEIEYFPANKGTTVEVRDLFYNIKSRRKFLKASSREIKDIIQYLDSMSIIYSELEFHLKTNRKEYIWSGDNRFANLLGIKEEEIIKLEEKDCEYSLEFFYYRADSKKDLFKSSTRSFIFVNKRPIKDKKISNIVSEWYMNKCGKEGVNYCLIIKCPSSKVDFNFTLSKNEVRFEGDFIYDGIVNLLVREEKKRNTLIEEDINKILPSSIFSSFFGEVIGQVGDKYIVTANKDKLYIIDQHAAHERIICEQMIKESHLQPLLSPLIIDMGVDICIFEKYYSILNKILSYEIVDETIIVNEIPSFAKETDVISYLKYIAEEEGLRVGNYLLTDFLRDYSCKLAIKAGSKLSKEEMEKLVLDLSSVNNNNICTHGRPTYRDITNKELDGFFHR